MLWWHLVQTFGQVKDIKVRLCIWFHRWSWTESDDGGAQCHGAVILWKAEMINTTLMINTESHLFQQYNNWTMTCVWVKESNIQEHISNISTAMYP